MNLNNYKSSFILLLFYALLATALLAPLSSDETIPAITDYINHIASVIEAKMAFAEGQFPLRIAPLELSGWRYPSYQFYSPTTYTIAGLIYQWITPQNPLMAMKLTIWLALVLGGFFMQRLAYWFVKSKPAAVLAGVVYLTAPYYVAVMTGLGNLCETVALGIVPAVLYYSLQRYLRPQQDKTLLQTGLAWYLLITTHMITFVYTAFFTALLLLIVTFKNRRHWKNLLATGIGLLFGCWLAMWYLAPIALLQKYFIIAQTFVSPAQFQSYGPALSNLLFPGHLYFQGPMGSNHIAIGWPIFIAASLCVYAFCNRSRITNRRANYWLLPLLILFFVVFMLAWSPLHFLPWMPNVLLIGQYCWRLLDQLIWIGALLFAWAVCWLFKTDLDLKQTVIGVLLLIVTASATFPTLFTGTFNVTLANFIKHPQTTFNPDAYTIEFNKQTGFVDKIDTLRLDTLMINNILQLNTTYTLPQTLLQYAKTPKLVMDGLIPDTVANHVHLKAFLNGLPIATLNLRPGKFVWEIPLNSVLPQFKQTKMLDLQFKLDSTKPLSIPINMLSLTGFLPSPHTLNVKTIQPFCQQQKTLTVCKINVPAETQLLELPILYYPALLHITLNGKTVPYKGIVYQNNLIAGIQPISGQTNLITIQFVGLNWANWLSWLGWILWAGIILRFVLL